MARFDFEYNLLQDAEVVVAVEVVVTAAVQCVVVAEAVIASVLIRYPFLF